MATCLWLTGRARAGKSTIARAVADELGRSGAAVVLLDEDVRSHLVDGRAPIAWLVRVLTEAGVTTIVASDLPARADREHVREAITQFVEVFVDGGGATSDDDSYEEPFAPELRVPTHDREPTASIALVVSWLEHSGELHAAE
ncbi:MAG: adenylyl-sulfate kinase [Acidimicrobiia bacterium]